MREGLGIYAGVLALRHGAPPGITFYEWEGWGERARGGGDEGRTQKVCASPSEAAGVGAESKSCRRNWSTAPGSTASQCGLYLDFYYVCVCEHKTELLPAAKQLVRSILTGLNASGIVNPLPPSFFQPMVFVDGEPEMG